MSDAPALAAEIRRNLEVVRTRSAAAASRAGGDPSAVTLIGITKTVPADRVRAAVEAGLKHLGENRVQEASAKISELPPGITWHLVGHLQSNKARRAADLFSWIHSIDSIELARSLDRHAGELGSPRNVLLQVDLAGEVTKHGVGEAGLDDLVQGLASLSNLRLRGLMTIPPAFEDPESSRPFFRRLRDLRDGLQAKGRDLPELSMGMTGDFEVAIEEGATMVRVGRAIFGERR